VFKKIGDLFKTGISDGLWILCQKLLKQQMVIDISTTQEEEE